MHYCQVLYFPKKTSEKYNAFEFFIIHFKVKKNLQAQQNSEVLYKEHREKDLYMTRKEIFKKDYLR